MMNKRAWLPVASELAKHFRMPAGYREVWSVDIRFQAEGLLGGTVYGSDILIEGPFPDGVEDGGRVAMEAEIRDNNSIWVRWLAAKTLQPLGDWMAIDG